MSIRFLSLYIKVQTAGPWRQPRKVSRARVSLGVHVSAHLTGKEARSSKTRLSAGFSADFSAIFQLSKPQCEGV